MENIKLNLESRKKKLLKKQSQNKRYKWLSIIFGLLITAFFIFMVIASAMSDKVFVFLLSLILSILGLMLMLSPLYSSEDIKITSELIDVENELALLEVKKSSEDRSETLFRQHHLELKRYYDLNLKQNKSLFFVGIICIALGFAIIGTTLYLLSSGIFEGVQSKVIVASMGALGAILTNFIAAIYLKMHTNTIKSMTEFHNRFVNTHHFYFSNFLISKIKDEKMREETLAELALSINRGLVTKEQSSDTV
ncbi:hypothetical protein DT035_13170 [Bacillus subtilis]|uniref:TRADD-N-associated membrane domain-containing protein n=1 Tax=Bacillus subtilis TaxID=1423 RepID=UPI0015F674FD|nr:hypothetical protein [Bacillus subtilis]MBA5715746.1 hypothetical protein [Bacillus subtilis]